MSQDIYVFSVCVLKNYFRETFGDHYPYEIIMGIIMVLRDLKILDLKIRLKNAVHKLSFMNEIVLQMVQCSSNSELSRLISDYYPIFYAEHIELENIYEGNDSDREETWQDAITINVRRWFCQIVDNLGSEESLYELAMAAHTWAIECNIVIVTLERQYYIDTLFIDCIPTDTSYKPSFTLPETFWFE
jgi:hypothetical protein